jgi:hypothetical protein
VELTATIVSNNLVWHWQLLQVGYLAKSRKVVPAQPVDATLSGINFFSKGGVWIVDSSNRQGSAASGINGEPGGVPPWRAAAVSIETTRLSGVDQS